MWNPYNNVAMAGLFAALGATPAEADAASDLMGSWAIGDSISAVMKQAATALAEVREPCGDAWEDEDSFGYGHECRLPKGHKGDHICANQDDDEDYCRWRNWGDTPTP